MEYFFIFVGEEWLLFTLLLALLVLWFAYESREKGAVISTARLTQLLNRDAALLIDLRPESDYRQGHISSATNIPYANLGAKAASLDATGKVPIIVVCQNGLQSGAAARILRAHGHANVMRLRGGVDEWRRENLPLLS